MIKTKWGCENGGGLRKFATWENSQVAKFRNMRIFAGYEFFFSRETKIFFLKYIIIIIIINIYINKRKDFFLLTLFLLQYFYFIFFLLFFRTGCYRRLVKFRTQLRNFTLVKFRNPYENFNVFLLTPASPLLQKLSSILQK